ncbi:MAG: carboxymuconolactone decarboxylase family protein [Sphingomonadaceae bacterium]
MPRIDIVNATLVDADTKATLDAVKAKIGMVPNLYATFAQAPAVLNGNLAFGDALSKGALSAAQREIVALAVAQYNSCHYCLSAHTMLGKGAGLSPDAIRAARQGKGESAIDDAIATLALRIVETRGNVSDADLAAARLAGLDDARIVEVVGNVAHNVLTNFMNNVAQTAIDFPVVDLAIAA